MASKTVVRIRDDRKFTIKIGSETSGVVCKIETLCGSIGDFPAPDKWLKTVGGGVESDLYATEFPVKDVEEAKSKALKRIKSFTEAFAAYQKANAEAEAMVEALATALTPKPKEEPKVVASVPPVTPDAPAPVAAPVEKSKKKPPRADA